LDIYGAPPFVVVRGFVERLENIDPTTNAPAVDADGNLIKFQITEGQYDILLDVDFG
jgi:hypothetical protein